MGLHGVLNPKHDYQYSVLKENRDKYILRLNNIYKNLLKNSGVDVYKGFATFVDKNVVQV